jgi:hypothetical protein
MQVRLPCKDGCWWEPDALLVRGLQEEFRSVNVYRELARMRLYLESRTSNRPKSAGSAIQFVRNWLRKSAAQTAMQHAARPVRPVAPAGKHAATIRALTGGYDMAVIDADA